MPVSRSLSCEYTGIREAGCQWLIMCKPARIISLGCLQLASATPTDSQLLAVASSALVSQSPVPYHVCPAALSISLGYLLAYKGLLGRSFLPQVNAYILLGKEAVGPLCPSVKDRSMYGSHRQLS
jgi:hypothetical protein